jgi:molybdate transport system substrate-binding protein
LNMRRLIPQYLTVLLLGVLLLAAQPAQAAKVYVSAAASLKEAVDAIGLRFARSNPGTDLAKNYGGSGSLAQQLENGAPVDIFISASPQWVTYLQERKLLHAQSVADFAYNELVFAAPPTTKAGSLKDLLQLQRIAIGSPKSVPAGEYAMEALNKAGIEGALAKKLVMARDVRECLMYAERGEVDGALVYRTDALLAKKSKILFVVPQNLYGRVIYRMALTVNGAKSREAQAFYRYLSGAQAKEILAKYGFTVR